MIERTLAIRYARALLAAAEKDDTVEETEGTLLALKEAYLASPGFRQAMHQPRIPRARRKAILRSAFEGKSSRAFLEFLDLLVDKKRVDFIPEIADAFDRLADASRGVVRVQVDSWRPLDDARRAALTAKIVAVTQRKVELLEKVDPRLKGGIRIKIGDGMIDGSVATRLKELRERLMK